MTPQEAVFALCRAYASRDPTQIAALLHPEVVWVAPPGNPTQVALRLGNNLPFSAIVNFMAFNFARVFGNPRNVFRRVTAEGNRVVVEHHLSATLPKGKPYANDYCFVYEVEDGKVRIIREYMDTRGGWV